MRTINEVETSVAAWKDGSYWLQLSAQVGPLSPDKKTWIHPFSLDTLEDRTVFQANS